MDEITKRAYRYLLYWATLEIRGVGWVPRAVLLNPFKWRRELLRVRRAGVIANWLHNLALYSTHDFEGFDEHVFWQEYKRSSRSYDLSSYVQIFENVLAGKSAFSGE